MHGSALGNVSISFIFRTTLQGRYHNSHLTDGEIRHLFRKTMIECFLFAQTSQTSCIEGEQESSS